jgi:hypothetical protein
MTVSKHNLAFGSHLPIYDRWIEGARKTSKNEYLTSFCGDG